MKPLARSLRDYSPAMLRAIAEVNGLSLASNAARQMVEQLTQLSWRSSPAGCRARCLLSGGFSSPGRVDAGRRPPLCGWSSSVSTGRLAPSDQAGYEREKPHLTPVNPTEELWYRGLIYSAFAETPAGMAEFLYVPGEIAAFLPVPEPGTDGLSLPACKAPDAVQPATDFLLHDLCTLLCLI